MKSEFEKFARGLSHEEVEDRNRLFGRVLSSLRRTRGNIFSFLQSRQPTLLMTSNILSLVQDMEPAQRREFQTSIIGILENIRSQFLKEVSRTRRLGRNAYAIPLYRLNEKYVEGLVERINGMAMKDAAADIVSILMSVDDRKIIPRVMDSSRPSWRSEHYEPLLDQIQELDWIELHHSVASELYVDADEVFDFLYDAVFEDGGTIALDMFSEITDILDIEDVAAVNRLYAVFEQRMIEVKSHFKDMVEGERKLGRMNLSVDDSQWREIATGINHAMDEIAHDLVQAAVAKDALIADIAPAPSFDR